MNMIVFSRLRRRALDRMPNAPPPIAPTGFFKPQEQAR